MIGPPGLAQAMASRIALALLIMIALGAGCAFVVGRAVQ